MNKSPTVIMSDENEEVVVTPEENETIEETTDEVETIAIPKKDYEKLNQTVGSLKREVKDLKKPKEETATKVVETQTGELSETQLDYLDLKGVTDEADIDVIQKVMQRTGQTVRQALADEYVTSKLAANKAKRDVQGATPSSTKRAGGQVGDVASAAAKFKETGVLPDDKALADAVVDSIAKAGNDRLPPWQR